MDGTFKPKNKTELKAAVNLWLEGDNITNGDISTWDTSQVTDMSEMFKGATGFNGNISKWNTSRVTNMRAMFYGARKFNKNISTKTDTLGDGTTYTAWNTSLVTDMSYMFRNATSFNGNISDWDTSSVTTMASMFAGATSFNQDIKCWDVKKVTNFMYMFNGATKMIDNYDAPVTPKQDWFDCTKDQEEDPTNVTQDYKYTYTYPSTFERQKEWGDEFKYGGGVEEVTLCKTECKNVNSQAPWCATISDFKGEWWKFRDG